jgi:hypothetical protein
MEGCHDLDFRQQMDGDRINNGYSAHAIVGLYSGVTSYLVEFESLHAIMVIWVNEAAA